MKKAIIIGGGPAGLTAAYELLKKTDIKPIIFELDSSLGGISRTIEYKGNRIDIGGHRFFSKSERVVNFWLDIFPLQGSPSKDDILLGRKIPLSNKKNAPDPEKTDSVMLLRNRLSRIFFLRKFFNYPISLNLETIKKLGLVRILKIGFSYIKIKITPIKNENTLEDFYINHFGKELYQIFFRDYTEKIWGIPCSQINADWGAQRVKGLSIKKAVFHALKKIFFVNKINSSSIETSLIESFFYPKFGPGQIWMQLAQKIEDAGGEIYLEHEVIGFESHNNKVDQVTVRNLKNDNLQTISADYIFSTMPIKDLINCFTKVPEEVREISSKLEYRDFITVGLLLNELNIKNKTKVKTINQLIPDTWIYIQEPNIKMCRLQIFNNWSPYMLADINKAWIGLEYVCSEQDNLWQKSNSEMIQFGIDELIKMNIISQDKVVDSTVIKVKKAYPSYIGAYNQIGGVRDYLNGFENLFCIGRNGMHRYNNMDHSMLTAIVAVDNIVQKIKSKDNIWKVNTENDYHESRG
jgi:protoporphyrinogen oxidase